MTEKKPKRLKPVTKQRAVRQGELEECLARVNQNYHTEMSNAHKRGLKYAVVSAGISTMGFILDSHIGIGTLIGAGATSLFAYGQSLKEARSNYNYWVDHYNSNSNDREY